MIPSQKLGTATPATETTVMRRSTSVSRQRAAAIPAGRPTSVATSSEATLNSRVTFSRGVTSSVTGRRVRVDSPKSPWAAFLSQLTY